MRRKYSTRDYIIFGGGCTIALIGFTVIMIATSGGQPKVSETYIPTETTPVSPVIDVSAGLKGNPGIEASTQMMQRQVAQINKTVENIKPLLEAHLNACILDGAQRDSVGKGRVEILQSMLKYRDRISENAIQKSVLPESCNGITTVLAAMMAAVAATGEIEFGPIVLNSRISEGIPKGDTASLAAMIELLNNQVQELNAQNAVRQRAIREASNVGGMVHAD